ncbi:MAG: PAS domain-containing protein [Sulfitobacter sp.]
MAWLLLITELLFIACIAVAAATLAQYYLMRADTSATTATVTEPIALLFTDGVLQHGTDSALRHFALEPGLHAWEDIRDSLIDCFPDFPVTPASGDTGSLILHPVEPSKHHWVELRWRDRLCWVTLNISGPEHAPRMNRATEQEMAALRLSSDTMINPVWHLRADGSVCWKNPAYTVLFELAKGPDADAEIPLFPITHGEGPRRVTLRFSPEDPTDWYEVTSIQMGSVTICHAHCINALISAEQAQRDFVQSLAKTFAHLSVGLAIFDRKGQLVLFNPALVDLTQLTPRFLSARPTMLSFFDQLRDDRVMPEPKDYAQWRDRITNLIAAAPDSSYRETWNLQDGRIFSVEGRPHPDGATAFLIEDISAEISLTRNFRRELELGQSLIDVVEDGLVVFSPTGALIFCNAAYRALWGHDPDNSFAQTDINDCVTLWRRFCEPSALWPEIANCISLKNNKTAWDMPLHLKEGRTLTCKIQGINDGATLIQFRVKQAAPKTELPALESQ